MRIGATIATFGIVLSVNLNGQLTVDRPGFTEATSDKPIKCGWSIRQEPLHARIATLQERPERQVIYLSPGGAFAVHYDTIAAGPDGMDHSPDLTDDDLNDVPDWVEAVAAALDSARNLLVGLGFDPAPADNDDGIYDVYLAGNLKKLYSLLGETYGLTVPETSLGGNRWTSYMEMDNDFSEESFYTEGLAAAQVTAAHEYFHAVQMGYYIQFDWGSVEDLYYYELSSTWFEEVAFPEVDDWAYWYGPFGQNPERNITDTDGYSIAIFGHYLTYASQDMDIMRRSWESFKSSRAISAIEQSLASYGRNLTSAWTDFVARLFVNGRDPELYPELCFYPDQELLEAPDPGRTELLIDDLSLPFYNLSLGTAGIQALELMEPVNLSLRIQSKPESYSGRVVLDTGGDDLILGNLTSGTWQAAGLSSLSKIVVVVGGNRDSVVVAATATDTLTDLAFSLDYLGPNPVEPNKPEHQEITLGYTIGEALPQGDHRIIIYNLLGQELFRQRITRTVGEGSQTLPLSTQPFANWPSGVYILSLTVDQRHTFTRTFTLLR